MENIKTAFILSNKEVKVIHQEYIIELNKALKKQNVSADEFIANLLKYMLENEFDPNFIRAIFGVESQKKPIYREEIDNFKEIFLKKMIKK